MTAPTPATTGTARRVEWAVLYVRYGRKRITPVVSEVAARSRFAQHERDGEAPTLVRRVVLLGEWEASE